MRIAHFTNTFSPTISGVVQHVVILQQALRRLGHEVFIFTENRSTSQPDDAQVFRYPTLDLRLPMDFPAIFPYSPRMERIIAGLSLDVVHLHHPFSLSHRGLTLARRNDLPVVFTFHTQYWHHAHYVPFPFSTLGGKFINRRIARFVTQCDRVVVQSRAMQQVVRQRYPDLANVALVPGAVEPGCSRPGEGAAVRQQLGWQDQLILLSVGRLGQEKNWTTFLEAAILAMDALPNLCTAILGGGPEQAHLSRLGERHIKAGRLKLLGNVPPQDVPGYLAAADLFGFASVTETLGRVIMEALAAGLAVVAVEAWSTGEFIRNGVEGYLTANHAPALAAGFIKVLTDPQLREQLRAAGLTKAQAFDPRIEARRLIKVYEQVA